ncbi:antibiotic biosynthesis monooxygenase [Bacillus thuringiensis]|uniref:antibiotic biosynthesis monooxygenase n=1 Tax=Bacillus thuringiensis TaxID=1428 RepID=UPI00345AC279
MLIGRCSDFIKKILNRFLKDALSIVNEEIKTISWFALRLSSTTFGIFDVFANEEGRTIHLSGQVAANLMAKAPELFVSSPKIQHIDILAAKIKS